MSRTAARLALLSALVGLGFSLAAAYVHYRLLADPTYTSFCDVNATWSCTDLYRTRFATFQGVSVAVLGAIGFAFATLLSLAAVLGRDSVRESASAYLFAGSTLALAVVLYLGYASFVIVGVKCLLCLGTYAAVIGLFLVTGAATTLPMLQMPKRAVQDLKLLVATPVALILAILWIGGSASTLAFFPRETTSVLDGSAPEPTQDQRSELQRFLDSSPRVPLAIPNDGAKVLIVKFADYQCPACGQAYLQYKPIFAKYAASHPGQVKVVMKDYPLDADCNANVQRTLHPAACAAAVAVRLARLHNKGDELEDWLYNHQPEMTPESVRKAARDIGQVTDFDARYAAQIELVKGDIALGKSLQVNQTPTFFLNGIKIDGAMAPQFFDQAIALELQKP